MRKKRSVANNPEIRPTIKTVEQWISRCFIAFTILLIICTALAYLFTAFSALTSFKFTLTDYGRYVNTIWNCAHGHPFRLLTEYSYLNTHLSFTLFLLAPAFLIWDHPFSLWAAQWLLTLFGLFIIWRAALRHRIPGTITTAFLLFYLANPFTQCVLLSEFHGVNLYLLLIPWLYFCLAFQKKMTWLPLILIWGVREEAAFLVIPMLLYFSIKDRWKVGYLWAFFSGLYGLFACTLLFRGINGSSLSKLRPGITIPDIVKSIKQLHPIHRLIPVSRLTAPSIPFLLKGWAPIIFFPSIALLFTIFSPYPAQYTLKYHYSAAPLILLILGMVHGIALYWQKPLKHPVWSKWFQTIFLLTAAALLHFHYGLLPLGHANTHEYRHPSIRGESALCAVSHLPNQGMLLSDRRLGGMCANRKDLIIWEQYLTESLHPEIIFTELKDIARKHADTLQAFLRNGRFGVSFFDGTHIIMIKGYPTTKNKVVLNVLTNASKTIFFAYAKKKGGEEVITRNCEIVRYWPGKHQGTTLVAYGKTITLSPGDYQAVFRLKTMMSKTQKNNGILRVVERKTQSALIQSEIQPPSPKSTCFWEQILPFHIEQKTLIEPQVLGKNSKLWLDYVMIQRQSPSVKEKISGHK